MKTRWVLLRGLTREAGHWGPFIQSLRDRTGDLVVAMDLPGSGARRDEAVPWQVAAFAERCRGALPRHDGPTVLLALSLGAMVALEWCRQDPGSVAACVLVNTSAGGRSPFWQRLRPIHYGSVARMVAGMAIEDREHHVLTMTSARPSVNSGVLAAWIEIARSRPVRPGAALGQLWAAARYRAPRQAPSVPVLLLASAGDGLVSPECSRRLARDWEVFLREHPWAGHDLPLDDPHWVIEQSSAWWRSVLSRTPQP